MDIPVNVEVHCADGPCGRSTYIIVNPVTEQVTHLVVREYRFPDTEFLVPLELVAETTPRLIRLRCAREELADLDPFIEVDYLNPSEDELHESLREYGGEEYLMLPYVTPDVESLSLEDMVPVEHEAIPPGELAVHRGTRVTATDGRVGRVDEFLIDPHKGRITHLVLRQGHLWGERDVTIPVPEIERIEEDAVFLKLNKQSIEALPSVPVHRKWR